MQEIIIAGGGIGGLTAALALASAKIPTHVLERRSAFSAEGAGIQLGPNASRILADLGVASHLRESIATPDSLRIFDGTSGLQISCLPLGRWIAERHGAPYWTLHRKDLQAALLARVQEEPLIRLSTSVAAVNAMNGADRISVYLEDRRSMEGKALIAADGLWSPLRSACFDASSPRPAGKAAYRTVLAREQIPDGIFRDDVSLWLGHGLHAVHYPVRSGRELALVVVIEEKVAGHAWSQPAAPDVMRNRANSLPGPLGNLLASATSWRKWALYSLDRVPQMMTGSIALLGDAAHPVLPFLAQGGALAIEDAEALARAVRATPADIPHAFAAYARERGPRVRRVARASRLNGSLYQLNGVPRQVRNWLLVALPAHRLMASYDWLYGWTGPTPASERVDESE